MTSIIPDGTVSTTKAGLAVGTTTTLTTANTQLYGIKGKGFTKAAVSNEATPTLDSNTGLAFVPIQINKGSVFVIARDAAGTLRATQGAIETLDVNAAFQNLPQMAYGPDTLSYIGAVTVKVGTTGAAWTFGVSNFSGPPTGVAFVFTDFIGGIPDRPVA